MMVIQIFTLLLGTSIRIRLTRLDLTVISQLINTYSFTIVSIYDVLAVFNSLELNMNFDDNRCLDDFLQRYIFGTLLVIE